MPLGRLAPLGRFGASWNIPLTVGDILYTPAGRIMRDERLLVTLLLGTYCTPLLRDFWDAMPGLDVPLFYRRLIHNNFCSINTREMGGMSMVLSIIKLAGLASQAGFLGGIV